MISYNCKTLLKDSKPWMPTMGEMQYSRSDCRHWKENLYKMKAGGIDIVSSYVMWIHHEEIEGKYDFRGNKNLRHFIRLVKECGLYLILRVGPFIHGECRNGGFPDWICYKDYQPRTNDERYLADVKKYFKRLYKEAEGFFYKDGGPIIGIQVENEFGPALKPFGTKEDHNRHMLILEEMLKSIGFEAPLYTATGWGNAAIGNCIPVWGGYCDQPWSKGYLPNPPNGNYLFTPNLNDSNIASDLEKHDGYATVEGKFPYITAELGGGIHATQHRRPIATAKDLGAMSITKLGSGANLLGYYIYCGGKNPMGALSSMQEYKNEELLQKFWTAYSSELPEIDYDFQAPISNWGAIKPSYKELKKLAMFTKFFGEQLSPMETYFPETNPTDPKDTDHLRYTFRHNGNSGFLFVNNYQRRYVLTDKKIDRLEIPLKNERITFNNLDINDGDYFVYPFNMKIGDAILKSAKAQPLCILNGNTYVFFSDKDPEYNICGDLGEYKIITLSSNDAANAYIIHTDKDYLFISESTVVQTDRRIEFTGTDSPSFKVYPDYKNNYHKTGMQGVFTEYQKEINRYSVEAKLSKTEKGYKINISYPNCIANEDIILCIDYIGDKGMLYMDHELVMDQYCNGNCLKVNLNDLNLPEELDFEITPISEDNPVYIEVPIEYNNGKAVYVNRVFTEIYYKNIL